MSNSRDISGDTGKIAAFSGSVGAEYKLNTQEKSAADFTHQKSSSVFSCFIDRQESTQIPQPNTDHDPQVAIRTKAGESMSNRVESGRCFCGAITARAEGEPFWINFDHDGHCRKALGSPLTIWIGYHRTQFVIISGSPKAFSKTRGVTRTFCAECGTSIAYMDEGLPDDIYLTIGFMNHPERFEPQVHAYWREKLPWIQFSDRLPKIDAYSRNRDFSQGFPNERRGIE